MILMIDNYDSFTYNLVQYLGELGADLKVIRNDELTVEQIRELDFSHLIISPGPGDPLKDGGISADCIRKFAGKVPILGVCLGHQCIGAIYGGTVNRASQLMHGKTSLVTHDGSGIFKGIPSPFTAMRYHSLIVTLPDRPDLIDIVALSPDEEIMAIKVKNQPTYGVQFHPESILTEHGHQLLKNFMGINVQEGHSDA